MSVQYVVRISLGLSLYLIKKRTCVIVRELSVTEQLEHEEWIQCRRVLVVDTQRKEHKLEMEVSLQLINFLM